MTSSFVVVTLEFVVVVEVVVVALRLRLLR